MSDDAVGDAGRLLPSYLPATYFDSSVLIDYWLTEGAEITYPPELTVRDASLRSSAARATQERPSVWGYDRRAEGPLGRAAECHRVTSPLALLELIEWRAEAVFKNLAAEAAGTLTIQKKGKKELGDLLRKILELRRREAADTTADRSQGSTGLEVLAAETWTDPGFARVHGFRGMVIADLRHFHLTVQETWDVPQLLAYLQVGMADIMHLLAAVHLGCTWFASFDSDFQRCRVLAALRDGDGRGSGSTKR